jgi:cytochrome c biogenesis factor
MLLGKREFSVYSREYNFVLGNTAVIENKKHISKISSGHKFDNKTKIIFMFSFYYACLCVLCRHWKEKERSKKFNCL